MTSVNVNQNPHVSDRLRCSSRQTGPSCRTLLRSQPTRTQAGTRRSVIHTYSFRCLVPPRSKYHVSIWWHWGYLNQGSEWRAVCTRNVCRKYTRFEFRGVRHSTSCIEAHPVMTTFRHHNKINAGCERTRLQTQGLCRATVANKT